MLSTPLPNTDVSACETKLPLSHGWPDMLTALIRDMVTTLQLPK